MNKIILAIAALTMVSCSPVVYEIAVDVRKPSEFNIDLKGCPPSIVCICSRNGMDSLLTSKMALGIAEQLEKEMSLEEGIVPVYSYFTDELDVSNPDDVAFLLTTAGSDRVIVLDSLQTGEFKVSHPEGKKIYGAEILSETKVQQPFRIGFKMFCLDSLNYGTSPREVSSVVSDNLNWSLLTSGPVDDVKAISRAVSSAPKTYGDMGSEIAAMFFPQWEEQSRMIIAYDDSYWYNAYQNAKSFKWDLAMKTWMKLVSGTSPKKVAYAAFNLAVACELQEQYDLALEWLELARSRYPFSEISLEKANIEKAMEKKKR